MELVLLQDMQSGYASNWARVANTEGVSEIQIKDRFREQGTGPGGEELEVAGIDISPVGGFSRLFFNRGANATQPEVHRLGSVFYHVGIAVEVEVAASAGNLDMVASPEPLRSRNLGVEPPKRKGRPPGSKNRPKELIAAGKAFGID